MVVVVVVMMLVVVVVVVVGRQCRGQRTEGDAQIQKERCSDTYRRRQMQRTVTRQMSFDLTKLLVTEDWFSDISPQTMRRLLNIVSITGRLLRANQIIFNWDRLASWINLTEEWPYRTSWIILFLEEMGLSVLCMRVVVEAYRPVRRRKEEEMDLRRRADPLTDELKDKGRDNNKKQSVVGSSIGDDEVGSTFKCDSEMGRKAPERQTSA
ncbi:Kinase D-interacting substrate [Liparis tanakae]|uniref:Kinase D-interacting substrate n=1 Tax=Liparis tanakae TaxID=230148 RepID=A0A4Z2IQH0_9TELE|nr:Kinase D-interacting substrate [Liparis tanakae]